MSRSVSYLNNAEYVIYFTADWINSKDDEFLSQVNWKDFFDNLKYEIKSKLKSCHDFNKYDGRETCIFLENELCEIGISEYCELYSLSVRAKDDEFFCNNEKIKKGLSEYYCKQIKKTLEKCLINSGAEILNKVGTFSNGESVYERKII